MDLRAALDEAMDLAVVPSFTKVGYDVRRRLYGWGQPVQRPLDGRRVVLTGATSGLGLAAARTLARAGAELALVARDRAKGRRVLADLGERAELVIGDLGDLDAVRAMGERLAAGGRVDVLVHNASALLDRRRRSPQGHELTFASMVLGPHLLTRLLVPAMERAPDAPGGPARVIWVASGGMYLQRLRLDDLMMEREPYRGTIAYARAKRAQVLLAQAWAERLAERGVVVHATHPGWADTPGVAASLPNFRRILGPLLRSPEQGADTIVWLASADEPARTTGLFWHDRRPRPIDRLPWTRASAAEREELWRRCEVLVGDG